MTFVDDHEVEEVAFVLAVELLARLAKHKRLVDREEHRRVGRHIVAALVDRRRRDARERVLVESAEVDEPLVRENVAVGDEKDARGAIPRNPIPFSGLEIPLGVE